MNAGNSIAMIDGKEDTNSIKVSNDGAMIIGNGDLLRALCRRHCLQLRKWPRWNAPHFAHIFFDAVILSF